MKFRDEVAKSTDGALKILKILLKVNGSAFNIKKLSDFTGFQRETVARNLGKLKKAGIVKNVEDNLNSFSLTNEFKQEYDNWKAVKNYVASDEDRARFNELNEKYWLIRPLVEALIKNIDMFNLCFISHDELTANLGTAEHTNKKYLRILEENQFLKIIQRGRFKAYALEDSLLKIWEEIESW